VEIIVADDTAGAAGRMGTGRARVGSGQADADAGEAEGTEGAKVPLQAQVSSSGGQVQRVWWFVDGELLGSTSAQQRMWWSPNRGEHRIAVSTIDGEAAAVRVHVR
jgi:membrane carboxypeptidase/penicillin-binding protein PbpC